MNEEQARDFARYLCRTKSRDPDEVIGQIVKRDGERVPIRLWYAYAFRLAQKDPR